jgi:thiamine pyrophosphate-dependent acetolactate synthase large subunit-like protein
LGLALARPDRRVLVATGDGELLMNVGALATIAVVNPTQSCDNGHYGETGYQKSHTSLGHRPGDDRHRLRHQAHPNVSLAGANRTCSL